MPPEDGDLTTMGITVGEPRPPPELTAQEEDALKSIKKWTKSRDTVDPDDPKKLAKAVRELKTPTSASTTHAIMLDKIAILLERYGGALKQRNAEIKELKEAGQTVSSSDQARGLNLTEHDRSELNAAVQSAVAPLIQEIRTVADSLATTSISYRDALLKATPPAPAPAPAPASIAQQSPLDPRTRAKAELQCRKFYVRLGEESPFRAMSRVQMVAKLNEAILETINDLENQEACDNPDQLRKTVIVRSATLLNTNSLLVEMNEATSRNWLFSSDVRDDWVRNLHDASFEVVVPTWRNIAFNVPLSHNVESNAEIEETNHYARGSIPKGMWAKKAEYRRENQLTGHLILEFANPEDANRAINEGLVICHKRVVVEKRKREPPRCRRCNKHGHYASSCRELTEAICGKCGQGHQTATCTATRPYCSNCKEAGHPAYARDCPTFLRKRAEMDERDVENTLPYYITDELWTHVGAPPSAQPNHSFYERALRPPRESKAKRRWAHNRADESAQKQNANMVPLGEQRSHNRTSSPTPFFPSQPSQGFNPSPNVS